MVSSLTSQYFLPGSKIVNEGDPGELFYIIKAGTTMASIKGQEIKRILKGDYFGEQALLYNSVRTATVTAIDEVHCLAIGRESLNEVLGDQFATIIYRGSINIALENDEILSKLHKEQIRSISSVMTISRFSAGDIIIPKDTCYAHSLIIVLKGSISVAGEVIATKFKVVGSELLTTYDILHFEDDLIADEDVDLASISYTEMEQAIGGSLTTIANKNELLSILDNVSIFKGLGNNKLGLLV
jgi:cGMP-dependent protein kinase